MALRLPFDGNYQISQTFGNDLVINGVHIYKQWGLLGHNGLDYGIPTGINILAPHKGTIKEAYFDADGYGWYVKIENDVEGSVLGHMLTLLVKIGDVVNEGQVVGISDNTGNSTGPHLHWGYYRFPRDRNNGFNGYIDQTPYLIVPQEDTIKAFLESVGYTYPEDHLEVVKAFYESDLKLKSGSYITKQEAQILTEQKLKEANDLWEKEKVDIENKLRLEFKDTVTELVNERIKEYNEVIGSKTYQLAQMIIKFFKF